MNLTWYGTASLLIETEKTSLICDPFPGLTVRGTYKPVPDAFVKADSILITHGHFDHIMAIPVIYKEVHIPLYCTKTPKETLTSHGYTGVIHTIEPGSLLLFEDLKVTAYAGKHCVFDQGIIRETLASEALRKHPVQMAKLLACNKAYPENDEILFYELQESSKRLQIMGSLGLLDEAEYPTGADGLVMAFQGRSDLVETAVPLIQRLHPKKVYLDHYDNAFAPMTKAIDAQALSAQLTQQTGIPAIPLCKERRVTV